MRRILFVVCLGVLSVASSSAAEQLPSVRLDSYKIYNIVVQNEEQLRNVGELGKGLEVHYLKDPAVIGRSFDVAVPPKNQEAFEERLRLLNYAYTTTVLNLQSVIERVWNRVHGVLKPGMEWSKYHDLKDIYNWLDNQRLRKPFRIKSYVIGYSYERRPIKAIKISFRPGNKAIFIDSNIHAIEWIGSAASTCFFDKLLNSNDPELNRLLMNYDWIFVPVVNPDGFEYSHKVHPLWRKNRKPTGFRNESGICYGVDLNRNFNDHWKESGWNLDVPCDHWYAGSAPETEPEVKALTRFIKSFKKNYIKIYIALHSYGNLLLLPVTDNPQPLEAIAKGFADAAKVKYGTEFAYGQSASLLYPVSGSAKDWAFNQAKIPFTCTLELRDTGKYGFFLPPEQIIEVCEELTDGLIGMIRAAEASGLL